MTPLSSILFPIEYSPSKNELIELCRVSAFFPSLRRHPSTTQSLPSHPAWPFRSRQPSRSLKSHHAWRSESDGNIQVNIRHHSSKRSLMPGSLLSPGFWQGCCNGLQVSATRCNAAWLQMGTPWARKAMLDRGSFSCPRHASRLTNRLATA